MERVLRIKIADIADVCVAHARGLGVTVEGLHSSAGYTWTIAFVSTATTSESEPNLVIDLSCKGWGTGLTTGVSGVQASVTTTDIGGFDLAFNATAAEIKEELEKIPHVGVVDGVTRTLVDDQGGFFWTSRICDLVGRYTLTELHNRQHGRICWSLMHSSGNQRW